MTKSLDSDIHLSLGEASSDPEELLNITPRWVRTLSDDSLDSIGQGQMENELVAHLATLLWRKRRVFKAERAEIESRAEVYRMESATRGTVSRWVVVPYPETMEVLARMETHLSREFERCLNLLERLQKRRKGQLELPTIKVHVDP